jgi:hypothetical protein
MKLWFYDQIGFSGANVQGSITQREPSAAGRALCIRDAGSELAPGRRCSPPTVPTARGCPATDGTTSPGSGS